MFRLSNLSYRAQRIVIIALFSIIPIMLLVTFSYIPVLGMFKYSFTDWNGLSPTYNWVGFDNFITIFTDEKYYEGFINSIYYFLGSFVQLAIALYFATILSFAVRGRNFFKGVFFFPSMINSVAVGLIFLFFFRPEGTLDTILSFMGITNPPKWLLNPDIINISLVGASVWRYLGFNLILMIGAISSVPSDLYEAAEIDGANRWHQFRYIILPSIRRIVAITVILSISGSVAPFEIPYIMTGGSNGSNTFVIQTVTTTFKYNKYGMGSAMAVVLFLIVILVTLIQKTFIKEEK
ncbi:carbohydrate ABC transporter permease [Paenibacillus hexagrammi]|uniref:Sugar ABC transporter permease n=1 Tax=Paenibacillus hexagrammi TaxID=2908839 RepID=A0ABY3SD78_9BACL|nr:sugar ABC transporter permease [Paenibacillus sp. YPD9-1]UJF31378.1 sugar ABC transporter permease [Paenibacillus sp. YPD9-1]